MKELVIPVRVSIKFLETRDSTSRSRQPIDWYVYGIV